MNQKKILSCLPFDCMNHILTFVIVRIRELNEIKLSKCTGLTNIYIKEYDFRYELTRSKFKQLQERSIKLYIRCSEYGCKKDFLFVKYKRQHPFMCRLCDGAWSF